jgi:hypothetical protein
MFFILQACRKRDEDRQPPNIQIDSPSTGAIFYYQNSISVEAAITDDRKIESVTLELTNAENIRFLEIKEFRPTGSAFDMNYSITHDDLYLASGVYYIKITASDGENESIAFREVQLVEAPRLLERIFIIRDNNEITYIDTLNSNNNLLPCINFPQPYTFGGIDSRTQQMVISGNEASSMISYSFPDFQLLNSAFPPSNETITAFFHDKIHQCFFWGTQAGKIWRTTSNGTQLFSTIGNIPVRNIGAHSSYILATTEGITNNFINVLRSDNGIIETSIPFNWEFKGLIELDSETNRALLIGNQNSSAYFVWLNLNTSSFNEVFNFYESSPVLSICNGSGNDFYVVHNNGLAHYSNLLDSYVVNSGVLPQRLVYDDLQQVLWAVYQDQLTLMDESGLNNLQTLSTPGIQDIWLKYTK